MYSTPYSGRYFTLVNGQVDKSHDCKDMRQICRNIYRVSQFYGDSPLYRIHLNHRNSKHYLRTENNPIFLYIHISYQDHDSINTLYQIPEFSEYSKCNPPSATSPAATTIQILRSSSSDPSTTYNQTDYTLPILYHHHAWHSLREECRPVRQKIVRWRRVRLRGRSIVGLVGG